MQKRFKFIWVSPLIALCGLASCASVPSFKPSKPLDQSSSLQEGLLLCNEYRLPDEPKRPVTLRPFLSCLDDLKAKFQAAATGNQAFEAFLTEFHQNYGRLSDAIWTPRLGTEIEVAVHTVLRALWQGERPTVTPLERELVLKNFPLSAKPLDAVDWNVSTHATFDPGLEQLKAGVASLSEGEGLQEGRAGAVGSEQSTSVAVLCQDYLRLKREAVYLGNLWRDQFDISLLAPQSPIGASVRDKYRRRLSDAMRDLEYLFGPESQTHVLRRAFVC